MHDDDVPEGTLLSRREILALIAALGAGALTNRLGAQRSSAGIRGGPGDSGALAALQRPVPSCVVRPAQTEGPYFVNNTLNRRDIRAEPSTGELMKGTPLELEMRVTQIGANGCVPLPGATVEVWQCDAEGVYSGVQDIINGDFDTRGKSFLRGHQVTDASGVVRFTTIYPGFYPGRAVHIHFSIAARASAGRTMKFTSQLYFDDAVTGEVLKARPYAPKGLAQWMKNERDGIFSRSGGRELMLATRRSDAGYSGLFEIGMQMG